MIIGIWSLSLVLSFTAVLDHVSDLAQHVIIETSSGQLQEYVRKKKKTVQKWSPFYRGTTDR